MSSSGNEDVFVDVFLWILFYWWARLSHVSANALTLPMQERTKVPFGCDLLIYGLQFITEVL